MITLHAVVRHVQSVLNVQNLPLLKCSYICAGLLQINALFIIDYNMHLAMSSCETQTLTLP